MSPHVEDTTTNLPNQPKDTYRGPRHGIEYNRLRTQHDLVKHQESGKLIQSPVSLSQPGLRILDSATGDGTWLIEVADGVPDDAELIGTDIAPQFFRADLPRHVKLTTQSILEPWPAEYQGKFDLVHQRFVLAVCSDAGSLDALKLLWATVKPGGWIEVHEGDMETIDESPGHEAMTRFRDMMVRAWTGLGHQPSPGPRLTKWLKEVGAQNIGEKVQIITAGALAEDSAQGERAVLTLLGLLDSIWGFCGSKLRLFSYGEMKEILG